MENKYWYLIYGFLLGWATKIPFLIKWYRQLKKTRAYEKMQDKIHVAEIKEKYNKMFPENKIE